MSKIYIGTSGWSYRIVKDSFFPKEVPAAKHLTYLSQHFNTVEINGSFYRLQPSSHYQKWHDSTPDDFIFSVKVPRLITHVKKMKDVEEDWNTFLETTVPLKEKRGPFLFQFPASFKGSDEDIKRMEAFFSKFYSGDMRSTGQRFAVEFRHQDCHGKKMLEMLKRNYIGLVLGQSSQYPLAPVFDSSDFIYLRFHGPKELFASNYSRDELRPWALMILKALEEGKDAYAYFNNAMPILAPENAKTLEDLVGVKTYPKAG